MTAGIVTIAGRKVRRFEPATPKSECPSWCDGHDQDQIETARDSGFVSHHAGMGGDILPQLRYPNDDVARATGQTYDVDLERARNGAHQGIEFVLLHRSVLDMSTPEVERERCSLMLTPGEARSLARLLEPTADVADLMYVGRRP